MLLNQVSQEYLGGSDGAYCMTGAPVEGHANEQQLTKAITLWMTMLIIGSQMGRNPTNT